MDVHLGSCERPGGHRSKPARAAYLDGERREGDRVELDRHDIDLPRVYVEAGLPVPHRLAAALVEEQCRGVGVAGVYDVYIRGRVAQHLSGDEREHVEVAEDELARPQQRDEAGRRGLHWFTTLYPGQLDLPSSC